MPDPKGCHLCFAQSPVHSHVPVPYTGAKLMASVEWLSKISGLRARRGPAQHCPPSIHLLCSTSAGCVSSEGQWVLHGAGSVGHFLPLWSVLKSHHMAAYLPNGKRNSSPSFTCVWVSCSKPQLFSSQQWGMNFISVDCQSWKSPQATLNLHFGMGLTENPALKAPVAGRKLCYVKCRN